MSQSNSQAQRRPVSCHFCRSRKLRCSRQFPCSNCVTRGVDCHLYPSPNASSVLVSGHSHKRRKQDDLEGPDLAISARLRRLEDTVARMGGGPITALPEVSRRRQQTSTDSEQLERECLDQNPSESIDPDEVVFRTCNPVQKITKFASYCCSSSDHPSEPGEVTKCIWIPHHEESKVLLEKYLNDITHIHHVIHSPSVRVLLDELYQDLDRQMKPAPGHVALLLSIVASTTYSWTAHDVKKLSSTFSVDEANRQSSSWTKAALDTLEYSRRTTSGSLEDIQATIILSFVVCNLESLSMRYRNLISAAITMGRQLLLHRTDHPSSPTKLDATDSVRVEMGRRVWYYLASMDWMLSRYAGPSEGLYTINPSHMQVKMPRNTNDEDLVNGITSVELPLTQPTAMSYSLQRIRLAELSRDFTDRVPFCSSGPDPTVHNQVLEVDAKYNKFIEDLPPFFCLSDDRDRGITTPGIIIQRYMINSLVYAHRCKLHIHYMVQSCVDPIFARSREICLHSARMILRAERLLAMEDQLPFVLTRMKFSGTLFTIVMAITVLLLDLCFNKKDGRAEVRKMELADACAILEEAKEQSTMAAKSLESFMAVLRKHQLSLPPTIKDSRINIQSTSSSSIFTGFSLTGLPRTNDIGSDWRPDQDLIHNDQSYFDELLGGFDGEMNKMDWNGLFSELEFQLI